MALFNKKKTQNAAAPATAPAPDSTASDDFSDFSPEALAATDPADTNGAKGRKGKKGADKYEKKGGTGRGVKPGTAIGLNIGNDSIKVVEAVAKGNEITITGMGMVPTPPDSISNGVVMSANALVMAIRDAMTQAGVKTKKVVTSISGTGALVVRVIEVPKMSDGELLDNMKMDADRYIPFPPSEVEMDFKALRELPSDPDSPNMEVLLAAAQREIIDLHVQVLQDAKLDPRAIDVEPLATARALTHPLTTRPAAASESTPGALGLEDEVDYNDVSTVLNIGASGTEISILRGDILVFTRTVPTGGNAMTQALVDTLGLAWSDAEQLKREMSDALPPTGDASGSTPASVGAVAPEDDWSNFGETATAANSFENEFFEQSPAQKEPGEQHQQKESGDSAPVGSTPGEEKPATTPPDASTFFDFGDETEPQEKMPTRDESRPASYADLLGEEEDELVDLPTLTPGAPPPSALPSAFDFPEETVLPTEDDSDLPTLQGTAPASSEARSEGTNVEAGDEALLPSESAPAAAPASFSFSFDDNTTTPAPAPQATPSTPASDFDFGFESPAEPVETSAQPDSPAASAADDPFAEFMASAGEPDVVGSTPASPAPTETADDFDIDNLFAEPSGTTGAASGGLNLGDIDLTGDIAGDDFTSDLADFGAGLGGASAGEIDAQTLYSVLEPVMENLVNEVRRSLEYHTTRYPDAAVRRVTIIGGGAKMKNLDAYLTQQLGLPVIVGNPALQLSQNAPKLPPGYIEENGTLFTVALGLAMRDLTK